MIGILFESDEWSDYKLAKEISAYGIDVTMLDLAKGQIDKDEVSDAKLFETALSCKILISRIFASAVFRGHAIAHKRFEQICTIAKASEIRFINPVSAHNFEISKFLAAEELTKAGIDVPTVYGIGIPDELNPSQWEYPCIIKPNCGGRTTYTLLAHSRGEAEIFLANAPDFEFIVQEYIEPIYGFTTRMELVNKKCKLVVKRSVVDNGLSAYHLGSRYELYPDCPENVLSAAQRSGEILSIEFGSFDIIENTRGAFVIDSNSVSNVSEDNTEMFNMDLMAEYASEIASIYKDEA